MSLINDVMEYFNVDVNRANEEILIAQQDLKGLKEVVAKAKENKLPLKDLCQLIGGHNLNENLFDVNFGRNILGTVKANYEVCDELEFYIDKLSTTPMEMSAKELEVF